MDHQPENTADLGGRIVAAGSGGAVRRGNRKGAKDTKGAKVTPPDPRIEAVAHQVLGAAIEVHRGLGPGFLESVYRESLCTELALRGIAFEREWSFVVDYKGQRVGRGRIDVFVEGCLVVELKAVESLSPVFTMQTLSYLRATSLPLGLLINLNVELLKSGIRRVINTRLAS